jgi:hypothetical protein
MKKLKASELVEDFDLYPRGDVSDQHVHTLAIALEAGTELPPIIIETKTHRIVDGFHRRRAHMKVHGSNVLVDVIEKSYRTPGELFLEAAQLNSAHGMHLQHWDYARVRIKAQGLGVDDISVAKALHITVERLEKITATRIGKISPRVKIPLKRPMRHLAGKTLSEEQVEAQKKLSGQDQVFMIRQVIALLENNGAALDREDHRVMAALEKLQELLEARLEKV